MENKKLYPTIKGFLSFEECQRDIAFHAENLKNAGYDTAFLRNRVTSLQTLLDLLIEYQNNADKLKTHQDAHR